MEGETNSWQLSKDSSKVLIHVARSQKLKRWALQLREFDFSITHRQGSCNQHADALSCKPVSVVAISNLQLKPLHHLPTTGGNFLSRDIINSGPSWLSITRYYTVKTLTMQEEKLLLIVPTSLQRRLLADTHDKAGHQGAERAMAWLSEAAYWVGMGKDVNKYNSCVTCQHTKATSRASGSKQAMGTGSSRHSQGT